MVRRRSDPLAETNIGYKTQITVNDAESTFLGIQKKLLHSHQIARHLSADFPSPLASFKPLAASRIGGLRDPQDTGSNPVPATSTADDEVGAN